MCKQRSILSLSIFFFYFIVFLVIAIKFAKLSYTSSRGIVSSYIATKTMSYQKKITAHQ